AGAETQLVVAGGSAPPVNSTPPSITGKTQVGQTLTAGAGSWSEFPIAYTYQWQRCDAQGANCAAIAAATSSTYTLLAADAGTTLRAAVVATNAAGSSAPATSGRTATVTWQAPASASLPTISGKAQAG